MNPLMKVCSLFFLFSILIFTTSCSDDEDNCVAPGLEENIIGTWSGVVKLSGSTISGPTTVIFNTDGTMEDNDLLISGEANGVVLNEKSWMILAAGTVLEVKASKGANFVSAELTLVENKCDFISFEISGLGGLWEFSR